MSYVVKIWEEPVPASVQEADRINTQLHREGGAQNPKFVELAQRLMARFPGPDAQASEDDDDGDDDADFEDGDVWTDVTLDGQVGGPVWGVGVLTQHMNTVLPFVFAEAGKLGLVVYDPQAGEVRLSGGRVLTQAGQQPQQFEEESAPSSSGESHEAQYAADMENTLRGPDHIMQLMRQVLDPVFIPLGFKAKKNREGRRISTIYRRKFDDCIQIIAWAIDDFTGGADITWIPVIEPIYPVELKDLGLQGYIYFDLQKTFEILESAPPGQTYRDPLGNARRHKVESVNTRSELNAFVSSGVLAIEKVVLPLMERMRSFEEMDRVLNAPEAELPQVDANKSRIPIAWIAKNPALLDICRAELARHHLPHPRGIIQNLLQIVGVRIADVDASR
jgi:hypothetical protein